MSAYSRQINGSVGILNDKTNGMSWWNYSRPVGPGAYWTYRYSPGVQLHAVQYLVFLYIVDCKTIIKRRWSFRLVFSGREDHLFFSIDCITTSCRTAVRFCLQLPSGCLHPCLLSMSPRRQQVTFIPHSCGEVGSWPVRHPSNTVP